MVIALVKLCLCFYLYHNVQVLVTANTSSSHILNRNTRKAMSIKRNKMHKNLIHTSGCTIPNVSAQHRIMETNDCKSSCGTRAVFIERLNDDNVIKFTIDKKHMEELFKGNPYECCSRFAYIFVRTYELEFTECKRFVHGSHMVLEQEIITVTCTPKGNSIVGSLYEDAYIIVQKLNREAIKNDGNSWNVLMMGMDTMSRGRAIQSMPKLVKYFKKNGWLDYRAFQKAESNTYPNLMITYTGIYKSNLLNAECHKNKQVCNDLFIWSKFKYSGFITAYGEDDLMHTFETIVTSQPTDHYTRSLFLLGTTSRGNILCLKKRPCAHHILDYAYQFAKVYKDEKYFGSFWTSRYSHDPVNIPTLVQNQYIDLFEKLNALGALNTTIIFFYGDHGVRYGPLKIPVASYYDDRLPMLYMWFPYSFRKRFEDKYRNLQLNQRRLTTHSDLHSTLWDILKLSDENVTIIPPQYCPRCGSLLEEKPKHRRCEDMKVTVRWCSCFVLNNVSSTDIAATLVPEVLLNGINKNENKKYKMEKILRHQWFKHKYDQNDDITYHVVAIQMTEANKVFEGIIKHDRSYFDVLDPIERISPDVQYTSQC